MPRGLELGLGLWLGKGVGRRLKRGELLLLGLGLGGGVGVVLRLVGFIKKLQVKNAQIQLFQQRLKKLYFFVRIVSSTRIDSF
jgi:hypothetical protein